MKTRIHAFTVIELVVAVAIVALIIGVGVPALGQARVDSTVATNEQIAQTLNAAIVRAEIDGNMDPVLRGNDIDAARTWLIQNGYVNFSE